MKYLSKPDQIIRYIIIKILKSCNALIFNMNSALSANKIPTETYSPVSPVVTKDGRLGLPLPIELTAMT